MITALSPALIGGVDPWILAFSLVTVVVTIWMGFSSRKTSKTASDFFVAGRSVSVGWNASAISGEYLSAASFLGIVWVAHSYQRGPRVRPSDERLVEAMSTGVRYIRGNRSVHRFALRITLAFLVTSALTALLPVVARQRLHVDAGWFGLVSTAVGVGAVLSIWLLPRVRTALGDDNAVLAAGVLWAVGALVLSGTESLAIALFALVMAGAGQMATMNVVFGRYMATLPDHVRGRAGSVVMLTVWLGASAGAVCWGWLASAASIATALAVAAVAQVVVSVGARIWLRLAPAGGDTLAG